MKKLFLLPLFLLSSLLIHAQHNEIDSLKLIISKQRKDTTEFKAIQKLVLSYYYTKQVDSAVEYISKGISLGRDLEHLIKKDTSWVAWLLGVANSYLFSEFPDTSIIIQKEAIDLARQLNSRSWEGRAQVSLGEGLRLRGNFVEALENLFTALHISRESGLRDLEIDCLDFIGVAYVDLGEYRQGLNYLFQAEKFEPTPLANMSYQMISFRLSTIGQAYESLNMHDSALFFHKKALSVQQQGVAEGLYSDSGPLKSLILYRFGITEESLGNQLEALRYYKRSLNMREIVHKGTSHYLVAQLFHKMHQPDSALFYGRIAFDMNQRLLQKIWLLETSKLLSVLFKETDQIDSAFHYMQVAMAIADSIYGPEKIQRLELLTIQEKQREQEMIQRQHQLEQEKERIQSRVKITSLLAAGGVLFLLAIVLYRNNRQKQKTNRILEKTLLDLRSTQGQLIQQEKMASLGELTAGIAHEIQNPLNFVNNFSEVNKELIAEINEAIDNGNFKDVKDIATSIADNQEKINHHGKRADAIVKNMLQHSRSSSGQKELTDINALCDEYLRLTYHGYRARDKSFNAQLSTNFDSALPKVNIIRQDIGRVMLNLLNNALYAVHQKSKQSMDGHQPTVTISTKNMNGKVEIRVRDNGNGISAAVKEKIFQPFFTTKPTGEGTGLGLSLAYDIITKAHGGEINVETKEGEASEFIISLPV